MKKKITLILLLSSLDDKTRSLGGVDSVCQMHLNGLKKYANPNYDYTILAFNPANDLKINGKIYNLAHNVHVHWYNYDRRKLFKKAIPNLILNELLVKKFIKNKNPDIVHSHMPQHFIFKYTNTKKICTLHSYAKIARTSVGFLNDLLYEKVVLPLSVSNADIINTVSMDIVQYFENTYKKHINYLANPINQSFFSAPRNLKKAQINILVCGNVEPRKRPIDALKILAITLNKKPELKLFFAGKYNPTAQSSRELQNFIETNNLENKVHFLGLLNIHQMLKQMAQSHIGLFLSENETFGLAPLEMMAAGVPVITTEVGVFKWCKEDFSKRGVIIVKSGDIETICTEIEKMIQHSDFSVSENLKTFLKESFSIKSYIKKIESFYNY